MTEYAESYQDEWLDEDELLEEDDDPRLDAIHAEIERWEAENGIDLSDEDYERMALLGDLYGKSPAESFAETDEGREDDRLVELAQRVAIGEGRDLTRSELERLAELDERANLMGEDSIDPAQAMYDLDTADGRAALISEKLQVPQEREEPSANVLDPETGESKPGFNLDRPQEQAAAIDALLEGQDVAVYDNTCEQENE